MNVDSYFVYFYNSTDFWADEYIGSVYVVRDEALDSGVLKLSGGIELGAFDSVESARLAIREDAGELGVQLDECHWPEDGATERWHLGEFRLLTPKGTCERYGEWSYEVAENVTDGDVDRMVAEALREARECSCPRPDPEALAQQLRFDREHRDG